MKKQSPRGVLIERCAETMQQIYKRTPMLKCDFNIKLQCNLIGNKSISIGGLIFAVFFQNTFFKAAIFQNFKTVIVEARRFFSVQISAALLIIYLFIYLFICFEALKTLLIFEFSLFQKKT